MHNVVNNTDVNLFSVHYSLCDIIFRQRNICGHSNCCVVLVTTAKVYKPLNYKNQVATYVPLCSNRHSAKCVPSAANQGDNNSILKGADFVSITFNNAYAYNY